MDAAVEELRRRLSQPVAESSAFIIPAEAVAAAEGDTTAAAPVAEAAVPGLPEDQLAVGGEEMDDACLLRSDAVPFSPGCPEIDPFNRHPQPLACACGKPCGLPRTYLAPVPPPVLLECSRSAA